MPSTVSCSVLCCAALAVLAFDIRAEAANSVAVNSAYVVYVIVYGLGYSAILLLLATIAFERKDI